MGGLMFTLCKFKKGASQKEGYTLNTFVCVKTL